MKPPRPLANYYGSKWSNAEWIISNFPEHEVFVDVFGGSASILLRKDRAKREVVNDLDNELVNLYRMVRDQGEELLRVCKLTPHSRTEYFRAQIPDINALPVERARRTIIKCHFGIGDSMKDSTTGFRMSKESNTCTSKSWVNWWLSLDKIIERFQGVLIECLDFEDLIQKYDSPDTLFYLDPPYVKATRTKGHGSSPTKTTTACCGRLKSCKGWRCCPAINQNSIHN